MKKVLAAAAVFAVCAVCLIGVCMEKGIFSDEVLDAEPRLPDIPTQSEFDSNFDFGVFYIDVGQGDCELIISGGSSVLIDAGEAEYGKTVVKKIKSLGVEKLDYIIATHPHADHIGGLPEVIKAFDVDKVIAPRTTASKTPTTAVYENFIDAVKEKGMKLTAAKPGNTYELDGAEMEILAPCGDVYDDLNDYSVVCRITKGSNSFLFTGDASKPSESEMLSSGADISADVLNVSHHGSKSASSAKFLAGVSPSVCVISCGRDNDYGHPTEEVLERISKYTDKIYRTDLMGTVSVYSDGEKLYIKTERKQ